jgi:lipooligosaccharide transport system ATP-binding protein
MTLDGDLTVLQNLVTYAAYHDIPRRVALPRARELLEFVQLGGRDNAKVDELSGGMQRRLLIVRALVSDPELVVLDEPTTGLDPQARQMVWGRLRSLRRDGKTLLLTTHYMDEAAQLCDRLAILHAGRVIAMGTPRELIDKHVPPRVVEVHGADGGAEAVRRAVSGLAGGLAGDLEEDLEEIGDRVLLHARDSQPVLARLHGAALGHASLLERDATLEDVFLRLTGRALVD